MKGLRIKAPVLGCLLISMLAAPLAAAPLILQGETLSYRIAPDTLAISVNKVPVSAGQPARQVDKLTRGEQRPAGTGLPRTPESRSNWTVMTCC